MKRVDIGSRIRTARKAAGLSQEKLARRANVSLNLVGRIETGVITDPHYSTLAGIADALGMQVGELLEETDSPKAVPPPDQAQSERRVVQQDICAFLEYCKEHGVELMWDIEYYPFALTEDEIEELIEKFLGS